MVQIDDEAPYNNTFPVPNEDDPEVTQAYKEWYTTPILVDGSHTVNISDIVGAAVDFALVTITDPDTVINRSHRVLVDDQDPAVHYTGTWRSNANVPFLKYQPLPGGLPVGNSTHQSQTAGDCLEFRFAGTSLEVYGLWYPPTKDGSKLNLHVTVEGGIQTLDPLSGRPNERYQNFLLFSASELLPTEHTITISVERNAQFFYLDYIVYAPSFTRMRDMPDLTAGYKGCNVGKGNATVPVGLIVGVVMGVFVCGLLTIIGVWKWHKRRRRRMLRPGRAPTLSEPAYAAVEMSDTNYDGSQVNSYSVPGSKGGKEPM